MHVWHRPLHSFRACLSLIKRAFLPSCCKITRGCLTEPIAWPRLQKDHIAEQGKVVIFRPMQFHWWTGDKVADRCNTRFICEMSAGSGASLFSDTRSVLVVDLSAENVSREPDSIRQIVEAADGAPHGAFASLIRLLRLYHSPPDTFGTHLPFIGPTLHCL